MESSSLDGGLVTQSEEALAFLAGYGWAMWAVQRFEYNLAALSILRSPVKSPNRLIDTPQKAYSALQKQFATCHHRFERASAKELQQLLPDDLPKALRAELDALIEVRNRLAHRYLHRTLERSERQLDLRKELRSVQGLGRRFVAVGDELLDLMNEAVMADRPPNMSDVQFEAVQRLGRSAASGMSLEEALSDGV